MLRAALLTVLASLAFAAPADAYVYWVNGTGANTFIARAANDGSGTVDTQFIPVPSGTTTLALNDRYIYWAGTFDGNIGRASLDSTGADPQFISGQGAVFGLATHGTQLYWSTFGDGSMHTHVRSANENGGGVDISVIEEEPGFYSPDLAINDSYLFRQRFQNGNAASATLFRSNLDGTGSDDGHPVSPDSHNAILRGLTATADRLYAIRVGDGPGADTGYPITVGSLAGDAFSSLIAGDQLRKYGLAQAGCRLYWSNLGDGSANPANAAAINSARIDGTDVHRQLITTDVVNPMAVVADLKPAAQSECGDVSSPPVDEPIVDPPPLQVPAYDREPPITRPLSIPIIPLNIEYITDRQLYRLRNELLLLGTPEGDIPPELNDPLFKVLDEIDRRLHVQVDWCEGPGCFGAGGVPAPDAFAAARRGKRATTLFRAAAGGTKAKGSRLGFAALEKALAGQARAQRAETSAAARVAKLERSRHGSRSALKRARRALAKARAAVRKLHLRTVRLRRAGAGASRVRVLKRQLARGKPVKVVVAVRVTDPLTRHSVTGRHAITIKPRRR